jgi:Glycosyltransferase family 87
MRNWLGQQLRLWRTSTDSSFFWRLLGVPIISSRPAPVDVVKSRYWSLAFFILSVTAAVTGFHYWKTYYLGSGYPGNTFLFMPSDMYGDFFNMYWMAHALDPYNTGSRSGYPPFANSVFWLFSLISFDYPSARTISALRPFPFSLCLFLFIPIGAFVALLFRRLKYFPLNERALVILTIFLLSYPSLFAIDRANLDLYVTTLLAYFIFNYSSKSETSRSLAALALAVAIALKVYPLLFTLIYIKDRRYHDIAMAATYSVLLTLGSWANSEIGMRATLHSFLEVMQITSKAVQDDWLFVHRGSTSFYSALRLFATFHGDSVAAVRLTERLYPLISAVIMCGAILYLLYAKLELWRVAGILSCLVCGVPTIGNDYRLMLFFPVLILANEVVQRPGICRQTIYLCMALLLVPKNIYYPTHDIGVSSVISGALVFLLLLMFCCYSDDRGKLTALRQ